MTGVPPNRGTLNEGRPDVFSIRSKVAGGVFAAVTTGAGLFTSVAPAQAAYPHDLHAPLYGTSAYPNAHGGAEYHYGYHMGREFDVGLRGIRALAGQSVRVYVQGEFFGAMPVSGSGNAYLHRHGTPPPHGARSYASAPSPAAPWPKGPSAASAVTTCSTQQVGRHRSDWADQP